ncbi:MAG: hypothetical protein M1819_004275 [Sarea resinae]|nr:MAG: hypothetical protein M1819_004275 [Sarea resinae]
MAEASGFLDILKDVAIAIALGGFALRYINIFFTPSFVKLPLSPSISGVEIGKIIGLFKTNNVSSKVIGYIVVLAMTAYMTRGLQLLLGTSKRALTERAEEMGHEHDDIPLTQVQHPEHEEEESRQSGSPAAEEDASTASPPPPQPAAELTAPLRAQDPSSIRVTNGPPSPPTSASVSALQPPHQEPLPLSRPQKYAALLSPHLDPLTYSLLFVLVGLPLYYSPVSYAMPIHLTLNILAYFGALAIPAKYKRFLHPVLVSSGVTILGTKYLQLWRGQRSPPPGAGDIFGSVLDASIVSLALPMFQFRNELKRHFISITFPSLSLAIGSLFIYPLLCYHLSLPSSHALAFPSRSLTLALATPATKNLDGDITLNAVLAIMSGILGVLIGPNLLKWMRIPEDDYVTRGVSLGINSSAIATALLLLSDPRAAALSSLSMSLFGACMVVLTSVPPIVNVVKSLAGLG